MALGDIHIGYLQVSSLPLAKEALVHLGGLSAGHLVKEITLGTRTRMPLSVDW